MKQVYEKYTIEDFRVWQTLFERQVRNLADKSCQTYIECLTEMSDVLNADRIPKFEELNETLMKKNGWSIEVVPGLIPVEDFFQLLSEKKFCSSTWLRRMEQLDYLEEPDMFHDIFGHIPLFMNSDYANFAQKIGKIGIEYKNDEQILLELQRIYWFTIEFGLINGNRPEIYGAGLISSYGETNSIYSGQSEILKFDLNKIISTDFCNSEMQTQYFLLESFEELYQSIDHYMLDLKSLNKYL